MSLKHLYTCTSNFTSQRDHGYGQWKIVYWVVVCWYTPKVFHVTEIHAFTVVWKCLSSTKLLLHPLISYLFTKNVTKYNKRVLFIIVRHTAFYFPADIWAMVSVEIWKNPRPATKGWCCVGSLPVEMHWVVPSPSSTDCGHAQCLKKSFWTSMGQKM